MAKVWVYCWDHKRGGENASWGHSSLQIEAGPYISWWPQTEGRQYVVDNKKHKYMAKFVKWAVGTDNLYKVKHRQAASYVEDVQAEKRQAEFIAEIADGVLNTKAIEKWWKGYAYEAASYNTIKKNCSTTVIRALRAGGSDAACGKLGSVDFFDKRRGWEPNDIMSYMRTMQRKQGDKVKLDAKAMEFANTGVRGSGEIELCESHGQPLLTCSEC